MAEEEYDELQAEIENLKASFEADVEDVRKRVIQVKREADSKAPADHEHASLRQEIAALRSDLEENEAAIESVETRLEGGFDNFEEILENLLDRTAELEDDLEGIGQAVRSMRDTLDTVAERERRRARADHLKQTAAARGVRTAKCEACNAAVDVALLSEPSCPSCNETFNNLDANPGFFGTSVLETGRQPALEGETTDSRHRPGSRETGDGSESAFDWQQDETGAKR